MVKQAPTISRAGALISAYLLLAVLLWARILAELLLLAPTLLYKQ